MIKDLNIQMTLRGIDGEKYLFNVYEYDNFDDLDNCFKAIPAIYAFSHRYKDIENKYKHHLIYLGETGDLSQRFQNHHKKECINKRKGNCIWIYVTSEDENIRKSEEKNILDFNDFPCNIQNN